MTANSCAISPVGVSMLLSKDDFLNFSEITDSFEKKLDAIKEVVECRAAIFMQKKEKHQQILDIKMMKLEKEKNDYNKKSEDLMSKLSEKKSQLMQIEHSYFNMKSKLSTEQQTNKVLKEKIEQLKVDSQKKNAKFFKTADLYSTVIDWYKNFLNIDINLEKNNYNIVTVNFKGEKNNFEGSPYVKLQILDGKKIKILVLHPPMEKENSVIEHIIEGHEVILFLQKFRVHSQKSLT